MMFTKKKKEEEDLRAYVDQRHKRKKLLSHLIGGCESPNLTGHQTLITVEKWLSKLHNHWETTLQAPRPLRNSSLSSITIGKHSLSSKIVKVFKIHNHWETTLWDPQLLRNDTSSPTTFEKLLFELHNIEKRLFELYNCWEKALSNPQPLRNTFFRSIIDEKRLFKLHNH